MKSKTTTRTLILSAQYTAMCILFLPGPAFCEKAVAQIYYEQALKAETTDTAKAASLYLAAVAEFDKTGSRGDVYAACLTNVARIELKNKEFDKAEGHIRKSLDASHDHWIMAVDYEMMGDIKTQQEKLSEADSNYSGALELFTKYGDRGHQEPVVLEKLASIYDKTGKSTEASALRAKVADLTSFQTSLQSASKAYQLGTQALVANNYKDAIKYFQRTLELQDDLKPAKMNLAICYQHEGLEQQHNKEYSAAEGSYMQSLPLMEDAFGPKHDYTCMVLQGLCESLEGQNKLENAEKYARRWVDIERETNAGGPKFGNAMRAYYRILKANGKDNQADAIDRELTNDLKMGTK